MNTSPQQSSPCCIFASRAISAREAFLQHGVFGKRLDFGVNRAESEFFNNIIYLYNIDRYMFTVYYPLVGRGNQGRKEGSSGGSLVGKQLTSKPSAGETATGSTMHSRQTRTSSPGRGELVAIGLRPSCPGGPRSKSCMSAGMSADAGATSTAQATIELLRAVAVYAAGGMTALAARRDAGAVKL